MNATEVDSRKITDSVVPLLVEYKDKLMSLHDQLHRASEKRASGSIMKMLQGKGQDDEYAQLMSLQKKLEPYARSLAQYVSQMIEHGELDELDRIHLMLRLAEFEYAFTRLI